MACDECGAASPSPEVYLESSGLYCLLGHQLTYFYPEVHTCPIIDRYHGRRRSQVYQYSIGASVRISITWAVRDGDEAAQLQTSTH